MDSLMKLFLKKKKKTNLDKIGAVIESNANAVTTNAPAVSTNYQDINISVGTEIDNSILENDEERNSGDEVLSDFGNIVVVLLQ